MLTPKWMVVPLLMPAFGVGAFAQSSPEAAKPTAPTHPNILIILTDDQGRGDYSAFGTPDISTPNIDRLAREGMTFHNFFANSSVCSPSRAALLTGCYPDRVGVPGVIREHTPLNSWGYLNPGARLLPQVLKPAGYQTALIGKWHLGVVSPNTPNERGFDLFQGFLGDMMDDYWTHLRAGQNLMRQNQETISPKGHATDVFSSWACEYLQNQAKADQPFFLYLAYNAPHDPIQPPPAWVKKVMHRQPGISEKRAKIVALIEHLDEGIGKVIQTLEKTGLSKNTLVIFTSDNGGQLSNGAVNGPWRGTKGEVYEGGLRVPAFAWWPGQIPPGVSTERMTLTMDIFATACEAAGVTPPKEIDGTSFLPVLQGDNNPGPERGLYFVRREGGKPYGGKTIEAYRRGNWKLLQNSPYAPLELYNLESDPQESHNLSKSESRIFDELSKALSAQMQMAGQIPWQPPGKTR